MSPDYVFAGVLGLGLILYALTAGADFGAGLWSLVSRSPHKEDERAVIRRTIAPVWEANHVWMIFVVVLAFTAFPAAFAQACIALHVPLTLALFGLVIRGSAFVFHAYGLQVDGRGYHRAFEWASVFTPVFLGMALAGLLRLDEKVYFGTWISPFGFSVGAFVLSLFSLLAATYLTHESDGVVRASFRRRALASELVAGGLAYVSVAFAPADIELIHTPTELWPLHATTAVCAAATMLALWLNRTVVARVFVIAQVATVVVGYLLALAQEAAQRGFKVDVAAPLANALVPVLVVAGLILGPSLFFLYWVFRRQDEAS